MSVESTLTDDESGIGAQRFAPVDTVTWRFSALNVFLGALGLVGPAVWENDDEGLVNTEPGLFLGKVAVNGPHALLHVLYGGLGFVFARDTGSARRYMGFSAIFWGAMAAMGWRSFGFERGVHMVMGLAVDCWGNLAHALFSVLGVAYAVWPQTEE